MSKLFVAASPLLLATLLPAQNLITNGDFSDGTFTFGDWPQVHYTHAGFTSEYAAHHHSDLFAEGAYAIGSNPQAANFNFLPISDHTGDGNMLIVNGAVGAAALNEVVWQTSISSLAADTNYEFEAFVRNINDVASWGGDVDGWRNSQAILQFQVFDSIGGWTSIGTPIDLTSSGVDPNVWNSFTFLWNSGDNSSTSLRLLNLQTAADGNDFALDGLGFVQIVPEPASVLSLASGVFGSLLIRRRRI